MRRPTLLVLLMLSLVPTALHAERSFRGGSSVSIELPRVNEDEMELLVRLDDGTEIRLTPELDASTRRVEIQLPNVSSRDAHLVLRAGDDHGERVIWTSESFQLESAPNEKKRETFELRDGEWWSAPRIEAGGSELATPRFKAADSDSLPAATSNERVGLARPNPVCLSSASSSSSLSPPSTRPLSRAPRVVPQRK